MEEINALLQDARNEMFGSTSKASGSNLDTIDNLLQTTQRKLFCSVKPELPKDVVQVRKSTVVKGLKRLNKMKRNLKRKDPLRHRYLKCSKGRFASKEGGWWEPGYIESCARAMLLTKDWAGLTRILLILVRDPKYAPYVQHVMGIMLNICQGDDGVADLLAEFNQMFAADLEQKTINLVA